jgi:hypothetical protein
MKTKNLNHASPILLESQRAVEVTNLTYLERLERLSALIKVSYMLKNAKRIATMK